MLYVEICQSDNLRLCYYHVMKNLLCKTEFTYPRENMLLLSHMFPTLIGGGQLSGYHITTNVIFTKLNLWRKTSTNTHLKVFLRF